MEALTAVVAQERIRTENTTKFNVQPIVIFTDDVKNAATDYIQHQDNQKFLSRITELQKLGKQILCSTFVSYTITSEKG